jgi:hypothetical protein
MQEIYISWAFLLSKKITKLLVVYEKAVRIAISELGNPNVML